MKKSIKLIKKAFIIISVTWTTITLVFITIMAFSGPSSCPINTDEIENDKELSESYEIRTDRNFAMIEPASNPPDYRLNSDITPLI